MPEGAVETYTASPIRRTLVTGGFGVFASCAPVSSSMSGPAKSTSPVPAVCSTVDGIDPVTGWMVAVVTKWALPAASVAPTDALTRVSGSAWTPGTPVVVDVVDAPHAVMLTAVDTMRQPAWSTRCHLM